MTSDTLTVGSIFSGIGGLDLGLERAGMKVKYFCECDRYAQNILRKHWPEVPIYDDVRKLKGSDIPYTDVIAGGFPCQDISYAGKGAGLEGERSGLFYEIWRLVCEVRPKYAILENVAALVRRGLGEVLRTIHLGGYDAEWNIISAASVGALHRRDRIFIIAIRQDISDSYVGGCVQRQFEIDESSCDNINSGGGETRPYSRKESSNAGERERNKYYSRRPEQERAMGGGPEHPHPFRIASEDGSTVLFKSYIRTPSASLVSGGCRIMDAKKLLQGIDSRPSGNQIQIETEMQIMMIELSSGEYSAESQNIADIGRLNPRWVDWLMGFPIDWTDCDASETPLCRKSQSTSDDALSTFTEGQGEGTYE